MGLTISVRRVAVPFAAALAAWSSPQSADRLAEGLVSLTR